MREMAIFCRTEGDIKQMNVGARLEPAYTGYLRDKANTRLLTRVERFLSDGQYIVAHGQGKLNPEIATALANRCESFAALF